MKFKTESQFVHVLRTLRGPSLDILRTAFVQGEKLDKKAAQHITFCRNQVEKGILYVLKNFENKDRSVTDSRLDPAVVRALSEPLTKSKVVHAFMTGKLDRIFLKTEDVLDIFVHGVTQKDSRVTNYNVMRNQKMLDQDVEMYNIWFRNPFEDRLALVTQLIVTYFKDRPGNGDPFAKDRAINLVTTGLLPISEYGGDFKQANEFFANRRKMKMKPPFYDASVQP